MQIGPRHWRMVSLETAGVPHGGPYGQVRRFSDRASKFGLYVGWMPQRRAFCLYTRRGQQYICQQVLQKPDGSPVALGEPYFQMMRFLRDRFTHASASAINEWIRSSERQRKERELRALRNDTEAIKKDAANEMWRSMGRETRPLISIPSVIGGRKDN